MKQVLTLLAALTLGYTCLAQCATTPVLKNIGSPCAGIDTLFVTSPGPPLKITWYNGTIADTMVDAIVSRSSSATTVAGGNGAGSAAAQLNYPSDVFVDKNGNVYVSDTRNNRIQMFPAASTNSTGGITVAGGNGAGGLANQLDAPGGIYVDASGYLYVADAYNGRIQRFPPGSNSTTNGVTVAGGNGSGPTSDQMEPVGLCFDGSGYMYVADYGNQRILQFPPNSTGATPGLVVAGGNGNGPAANQFSGCYAVLVDGAGNVYVADQTNCRVQKFPPGSTSATNGITVAGGNGSGSAANQFMDPTNIYIDAAGNLYVDDDLGFRIQEFPPGSTGATNGVTVAGGNGSGDAANQFNNSYGMYIDADGNIYVADDANCRIQKFALVPRIDTTLVPAQPGTYTALVTDGSGCSSVTNAIVVKPLPPAPSLSISTGSTTICAGDKANFTAFPVNAGTNPAYQWQVNGNNIGPNSDTLTTVTLVDGDKISCILTSMIQCTSPDTSTNSVDMTVNPLPIINFDPDTLIIRYGGKTSLDPAIGGAITGSRWLPATALDNPEIPDPIADPVRTTTYELTVTSVEGCVASGKTTVVVYTPLDMPSAFTPNGDGRNDIFRIPPGAPQEIQRFSVYNRLGVLEFTSTDGSAGWDGTADGIRQPAGTYVWMISYRDPITHDSKTANGAVLLIR